MQADRARTKRTDDFLLGRCYTEKAPNAWHRRGKQKTGNTHNQPKRPSTDTIYRPSTRHYRKGSPGVKTHNTNQHSSRAGLHNSNHPPLLPTPDRVITRCAQPTQPAAKHRRAEQTPPASAGTHSATRALGGPSSGVADGQPRVHGLLLRRGRGDKLRYLGEGVGRGAGAEWGVVGALPLAEDRWAGEGGRGGGHSTTDPEAGAGCKSRSSCEDRPAPVS